MDQQYDSMAERRESQKRNWLAALMHQELGANPAMRVMKRWASKIKTRFAKAESDEYARLKPFLENQRMIREIGVDPAYMHAHAVRRAYPNMDRGDARKAYAKAKSAWRMANG